MINKLNVVVRFLFVNDIKMIIIPAIEVDLVFEPVIVNLDIDIFGGVHLINVDCNCVALT